MNNDSNQKRKVMMKASENHNKMYNKNKGRFWQQGYPAEVDVAAKLKSHGQKIATNSVREDY